MKKNIIRLISIILILVFCASSIGCRKYRISKDSIYSDNYIKFHIPEDHFLAVDMTEEMGTAYLAYYVFKGETDFTGSTITYMTMKFDEASFKMAANTEEEVKEYLTNAFGKKGKTVEIIDYKNITQEGCLGYIVEYNLTDDESDEVPEGTRIMVVSAMKNEQYGVIMFFVSNNADLNDAYREGANSLVLRTFG